jgi:enoyl-CoA hydratase/carnithine racemase
MSGNGPTFCAGLDTGVFNAMDGGSPRSGLQDTGDAALPEGDPTAGLSRGQRAMRVWAVLPVRVIAAVHSAALGAGIQLTLASDTRVAAPDAVLEPQEINRGLAPDQTGSRLVEVVGAERAKGLICTGRTISGHEAAAFGLASRVSADTRADALGLAHEIAGKSPSAIREAKWVLDVVSPEPAKGAFAAEREATARLLGRPNQTEAVRARLEKRPPVFHDD